MWHSTAGPSDRKDEGRAVVGRACAVRKTQEAIRRQAQLCEISNNWAHQRRDILRAEAGLPSPQGWRDAWIERIGRLFHLAKLRRQA